MNINYGIVVYFISEDGTENIVHMCGYAEPYTINDVKGLTIELLTDEEFGLTEALPHLLYRPATEEELVMFNTVDK